MKFTPIINITVKDNQNKCSVQCRNITAKIVLKLRLHTPVLKLSLDDERHSQR